MNLNTELSKISDKLVYDEITNTIMWVEDGKTTTIYDLSNDEWNYGACIPSLEFAELKALLGKDNPFKNYTDKLAEVLLQKNRAYGDSFTKSVDDYGLSVIGIRLSDKYNRIHHLITAGELKENDESLEDTLLDMAGYSILALKYLKERSND